MKSPSDPLFEKLGSYLDQELSATERNEIEKLLTQDAEARLILSEIEQINQLGDLGQDQLPGDAYFADLPSRVLHRIQVEEAAVARPIVNAPQPGFWQRLFSPAHSWRWATATATIGALGVGAWFIVQSNTVGFLTTAPAGLNELNEAGPASAEANPNDRYVARVAETLGGYGNLGSSLDQGLPVGNVIEPSDRSLIKTVSFEGLSVPGRADRPLPKAGATVEEAFNVARLCERTGAPVLAGNGYRLVFESTQGQQDLHHAAHLGYIRSQWRYRLQKNPDHAKQLFNQLMTEAKQGYQHHVEDNHQNCERCWAVTTSAEQLGMKVFSADTLNRLHQNAAELRRCCKSRQNQ